MFPRRARPAWTLSLVQPTRLAVGVRSPSLGARPPLRHASAAHLVAVLGLRLAKRQTQTRSRAGAARRAASNLAQGFQGTIRARVPRQHPCSGSKATSVLGFQGNIVQWFRGNIVLGFQGNTVPGFQGNTVLGLQGSTVLGLQGNTVLGLQGNAGLGFQGNTVLGFQGNTVLWFQAYYSLPSC